MVGLSRAESEKIQQLFHKYFEESSQVDVAAHRHLPKRAARTAIKQFEKYETVMNGVCKSILRAKQEAGDDLLEVTVRLHWSWMWALVEKVCPALLPRPRTIEAPPQSKRTDDRLPKYIVKLERRGDEVRTDLSKFVALVQLHEKQGWNKLPPRKTWQEFGDKYRAKTPDMWQQWAHRLKDELITLKVQLRQCKKKRHAKRDSAGLALGVKSYMLRHTCPDTDEIDTEQIPAQEQKVVATFTEVWNQESADDGLADEEWFQDHAKEVREKIGGKEIKLDVELVREALQSTASWKATGFEGVSASS